MNALKLFVVAGLAAVLTIVSASVASAAGNRFGTLNLNTAAKHGTYDTKPVHYRYRYRRYRKYRRRHYYNRRYYRRRHYKRRYYGRRYYRRHYYRRHYYRPYYYGYYGYYGPSVYFRAPGFGFHFGY